MNIEGSKTALLVIDMQNDFTEEGARFEIPRIRESFSAFSEFIARCRTAGALMVYTRHTYDPNDNVIEAELFPNLADGGLRESSHGWEITAALAPAPADVRINKPRYDAFYKTDLETILRERSIDTLIIAGTMTEICCESTARSGMYRNYKVLMVSDLTFTRDPKTHEQALKTFGSHFGWVRTAKETAALLT